MYNRQQKKRKGSFKYVDALSYTKEDVMRNTPNDDLAQRGYIPFVTNRSLSYHQDCVLYANEMNMRPHLDNLLQFDYFINTIRKRKRYATWAKPEADCDLDLVMEYFGYSRIKAEMALSILSTQDISEIYKIADKGGIQNEQRKHNKGSD